MGNFWQIHVHVYEKENNCHAGIQEVVQMAMRNRYLFSFSFTFYVDCMLKKQYQDSHPLYVYQQSTCYLFPSILPRLIKPW